MIGRSLKLFAPAKLNLHLSVLDRRQDGYHLLESLLVKLDLGDCLTLKLTDTGLDLNLCGLDAPPGRENLAFRAAELFFRQTGLRLGVEIELEKKIPVAAGLGGGSSDAAAVLLGLNSLCGRPLPDESLRAAGLTLGADVPFFMCPHAVAWAEGIGERLRPGPSIKGVSFLLVNPGWPLSTAEVYKNFKLKLTSRRQNHIFDRLNASSFTIDRFLYNDLETVVLPKRPEVKMIKALLLASGAVGALMSGSGPTVFGVFNDRLEMDLACRKIQQEGPDHWWVRSADILTGPGLNAG